MGFRFRKSVKLGPLRINFSKSGVGYSYGVKGYRVTHTATGRKRTTVSIPGTGISHITETPKQTKAVPARTAAPDTPQEKKNKSSLLLLYGGIALLALVLFLLSGCSSTEPGDQPGTTAPAVSASQPAAEPVPAPAPEPEPEPVPEPEPEPEPTPEPEPAPEPEPVPEPEPEPTAEELLDILLGVTE